MYPTVHFLDKSATFINREADTTPYDMVIEAADGISRAKVIKILETYNNIAIISNII